ncbi:MAG TPA: MFS transporter [Chloroflexota bacterium]|nr:MFS transporter [Chloroflexota bacterium]
MPADPLNAISTNQPGAGAYRGVLFASIWAFTGLGATFTVTGPLLQPIRETFGRGQSEMGLVFLVTAFAYIVSVAGTAASDQYGRRPFVLAAPMLIVLGFLVVAVSPDWIVFLAGAYIFGSGMGLIDGLLNALAIDVAPRTTASTLNYLHLFFGVGAVVGPLIIGVVLEAGVHWRVITGATALLAITMFLPYLFVRFPPQVQTVRPPFRTVLATLLRPRPLLMLAVIVFYVGIEVTYNGWLPSYFEVEIGASRSIGAYSVAIMWVGIVAGRGLSGIIAHHVDHHLLLAASMGASVLSGLVVVATSSIPVAFAALLISGAMIGGAFPTALAIGVRGQRAMVGALTAFIVAGAGIGGVIFPPVAGLIADGVGFRAAMLFTGLLAIGGAAAALAAYFRRHRDASAYRSVD